MSQNARRYEWLRDHISEDGQFFMLGRVLRSAEDLDAAIDAAMPGRPTGYDCPACGKPILDNQPHYEALRSRRSNPVFKHSECLTACNTEAK
jgi:hypothetical protein